MYKLNCFFLVLFVAFMSFEQNAAADTICLRSVLKNGKIKNSTAVVASGAKCPRNYSPIIDNQTLSAAGLQQGPEGPQGPQGPQGPAGQQGPPGEALSSSYVFVRAVSDPGVSPTSDSPKLIFASCPLGYVVQSCSGGVTAGLGEVANLPIALSFSGPNVGGGSCAFRAYETTATSANWRLEGTAICVLQG